MGGWRAEAGEDGGGEGDGEDEFAAGVGLREDRVEDCGEVEDVEGRGVRGCYDGAGAGHVRGGGFA